MFTRKNCEISPKSVMKEKFGKHRNNLKIDIAPSDHEYKRFGLETSEKMVNWALEHVPPSSQPTILEVGSGKFSCLDFSKRVTTRRKQYYMVWIIAMLPWNLLEP
jgi:hypothetical protein